MKNVSVFILITLIFIIPCSCKVDKKALTIKDKYYFHNDFRMDGYYIREESDNNDESYVFIRYFFQNGSCYHAAREDSVDNNQCYPVYSRDTPFFWGYFTVNEDDLYIQSYAPSGTSIGKITIDQYFGKIENDTTLRLYRRISWWKEDMKINEVYRFHYCENKPDSTNILMTY